MQSETGHITFNPEFLMIKGEMDNVRKDIKQKIHGYIIDQLPFDLKEDDLNDHLPLLKDGLGLDSIAAVELFFKLEDDLNIQFAAELFENIPITIGKIIDYVMANTEG